MKGNVTPIESEFVGKDWRVDRHSNRLQPFTVWRRISSLAGWECHRFCESAVEASVYITAEDERRKKARALPEPSR